MKFDVDRFNKDIENPTTSIKIVANVFLMGLMFLFFAVLSIIAFLGITEATIRLFILSSVFILLPIITIMIEYHIND